MYHSITFGNVSNGTFSGKNTWDDWHLIPSSGPVIAQSSVSDSFKEIPGRKNGPMNFSDYLTGKIIYGQRNGSIQFVVDNDHEDWTIIQSNIVNYLHGKYMKMRLEDDPDYYYEGRFTVGNWESESWNSSITISYSVKPYKYRISNGKKAL